MKHTIVLTISTITGFQMCIPMYISQRPSCMNAQADGLHKARPLGEKSNPH